MYNMEVIWKGYGVCAWFDRSVAVPLTLRNTNERILCNYIISIYVPTCGVFVIYVLYYLSVLGSDTRILKVKHNHPQTHKRQTLLSRHNRIHHRSFHEQQEIIYFTCRTSKSYKLCPTLHRTHSHNHTGNITELEFSRQLIIGYFYSSICLSLNSKSVLRHSQVFVSVLPTRLSVKHFTQRYLS